MRPSRPTPRRTERFTPGEPRSIMRTVARTRWSRSSFAGDIGLPLAQKCSARRVTPKTLESCSQLRPLSRRISAIAGPAPRAFSTEPPAEVCSAKAEPVKPTLAVEAAAGDVPSTRNTPTRIRGFPNAAPDEVASVLKDAVQFILHLRRAAKTRP